MKIFLIKISIIVLSLIIHSCENHEKTIVLKSRKIPNKVIYSTNKAKFYFNKKELITYCNEKVNRESSGLKYTQVIKFLKNTKHKPVLIQDTLATKLVPEKEFYFWGDDSLIRVRKQNHPYNFVTEGIRWALLDFASAGNLRIYDDSSGSLIDTIIVKKEDSGFYEEKKICKKNGDVIFSQLTKLK